MQLNDQRIKILQAAKIYDESIDVKTQFSKLEMKYVDNLNTGKLSLIHISLSVIEQYDQLTCYKRSKPFYLY